MESIICPFCGDESFHPKDVRERWCNKCEKSIPMSETEFKPSSIIVYNSRCVGCVKHESDIMLSITPKEPPIPYLILNFFLTTEQAKELIERLFLALQRNEQYPKY